MKLHIVRKLALTPDTFLFGLRSPSGEALPRFTPGAHVRALEQNGFRVRRLIDYSEHYAKTTAAWYERMMAHRDLGDPRTGER